jgi:hypothetical protein
MLIDRVSELSIAGETPENLKNATVKITIVTTVNGQTHIEEITPDKDGYALIFDKGDKTTLRAQCKPIFMAYAADHLLAALKAPPLALAVIADSLR